MENKSSNLFELDEALQSADRNYIEQYEYFETQVAKDKKSKYCNTWKSFTAIEMILIVILSPLILFLGRYYRSSASLTSLFAGNYFLKFWQKLICIIIGLVLWYFALKSI